MDKKKLNWNSGISFLLLVLGYFFLVSHYKEIEMSGYTFGTR